MEQLSDALEKIWIAGSDLLSVGADFAKDSENATLQSMIVEASRSTLKAMVKLILVADVLDSNKRLKNSEQDDGGFSIHNDSLHSQLSDVDQQKVMRCLPETSKQEIQKEIDVFKIEQLKFKREVGKWDETGNDLIALANRMYHIMGHMTDFTKGQGRYRTTKDVIRAAQNISSLGAQLNRLARQIGNECVKSDTKKDLFAYSEQITLFCHQLNVTSKVKSYVEWVGDECQVSGVESALCLIQNAKNLLNAVTHTVSAAEIASMKYRRLERSEPKLLEWRKVEHNTWISMTLENGIKSPPEPQSTLGNICDD